MNASNSSIAGPRQVWAMPFLIIAAFLLGCQSARGQTEEGIKAAFVYNFAKFTEWPAGAFASPAAPITVGFLGGGGLADTFEKNVVGKNAGGRDFAVKKLGGPAEAAGCQIVFVGDAGQAAAVIAAVKDKPVLTLGDSDGFAAAGGMVHFVKEGAKITFDLDLKAVAAAQLKLDPKLKQIARTVKGP